MSASIRTFKKLLGDLPMTQETLAKKTGKARSTISNWATCRTDPSKKDIVAALAVIQKRLAEIHKKADSVEAELAREEAAAKKGERKKRGRKR